MPQVSVIVPAYNATKYLAPCLDSLAAQTLTDIEILMVNDGSTDAGVDEAGNPTGTLAMMQEYAARDPRFVVVDKPNSGYGDNINIGIARATGKYVGILEADDFAEPDFLQTLFTMAEENDLDVARGQFWLYWSTREPHDVLKDDLDLPGECDVVINPSDPAAAPEDSCHHVFTVHHAIWASIYRRDFLLANNITCCTTPGASFQDSSFDFKVWANAKRVMFTRKAFIHYRQDNEASSINNPGKVYMIPEEYREILAWLEAHPQMKPSLYPVVRKMQYDAYLWNFQRLAPQYQEEFAACMKEHLGDLVGSETLASPVFGDVDRGILKVLVTDTPLFIKWRSTVAKDASALERLAHKLVTIRALLAAK